MHDRSGVRWWKHVWEHTIWWCHLHEGSYCFPNHIYSPKILNLNCNLIITTFVFLLCNPYGSNLDNSYCRLMIIMPLLKICLAVNFAWLEWWRLHDNLEKLLQSIAIKGREGDCNGVGASRFDKFTIWGRRCKVVVGITRRSSNVGIQFRRCQGTHITWIPTTCWCYRFCKLGFDYHHWFCISARIHSCGNMIL